MVQVLYQENVQLFLNLLQTNDVSGAASCIQEINLSAQSLPNEVRYTHQFDNFRDIFETIHNKTRCIEYTDRVKLLSFLSLLHSDCWECLLTILECFDEDLIHEVFTDDSSTTSDTVEKYLMNNIASLFRPFQFSLNGYLNTALSAVCLNTCLNTMISFIRKLHVELKMTDQFENEMKKFMNATVEELVNPLLKIRHSNDNSDIDTVLKYGTFRLALCLPFDNLSVEKIGEMHPGLDLIHFLSSDDVVLDFDQLFQFICMIFKDNCTQENHLKFIPSCYDGRYVLDVIYSFWSKILDTAGESFTATYDLQLFNHMLSKKEVSNSNLECDLLTKLSKKIKHTDLNRVKLTLTCLSTYIDKCLSNTLEKLQFLEQNIKSIVEMCHSGLHSWLIDKFKEVVVKYFESAPHEDCCNVIIPFCENILLAHSSLQSYDMFTLDIICNEKFEEICSTLNCLYIFKCLSKKEMTLWLNKTFLSNSERSTCSIHRLLRVIDRLRVEASHLEDHLARNRVDIVFRLLVMLDT